MLDFWLGWDGTPAHPASRQRLAELLGGHDYLALFLLWFGLWLLPMIPVAIALVARWFLPFPDWLDGDGLAAAIHAEANEPGFVGRETQLFQLSALDDPREVWRVVTGLSGTGKTRLVRHWAALGRSLVVGKQRLTDGKPSPNRRWHDLGGWCRLNLPRLGFGPSLRTDRWDAGFLPATRLSGKTLAELPTRRQTIIVIDRPPARLVEEVIAKLRDHKADPKRSISVVLIDILEPRQGAGEVAPSPVRCAPLSREETRAMAEGSGLSAEALTEAVLDHLHAESGGVPLVLGWLVGALKAGKPIEEVTAGAALEEEARGWVAEVQDAQAAHGDAAPMSRERLALVELAGGGAAGRGADGGACRRLRRCFPTSRASGCGR